MSIEALSSSIAPYREENTQQSFLTGTCMEKDDNLCEMLCRLQVFRDDEPDRRHEDDELVERQGEEGQRQQEARPMAPPGRHGLRLGRLPLLGRLGASALGFRFPGLFLGHDTPPPAARMTVPARLARCRISSARASGKRGA